ncbi:MAG: DNRLRE domain-containing protein [Anaerolineales bacterium]
MRLFSVCLSGILLLGCVPPPEPMTATPTPTKSQPIPSRETPTPPITPKPEEDPILVGAGDIADCNSNGDEATANLLDTIPGTVFTTGDNAYPDGAAFEFMNCYDLSWGRHKARTYPSPGNHDYHTNGAAGYYDYFGSSAGDPDIGYYSYDLGTWHIVVLNSNLPVEAGSPQEQWLRADLSAHPVACTLAYWHHPRFSSGLQHGSNARMQSLWQALYDYDADVVLAGHEHNYERFAPQNPQGVSEPTRGIRQFVVGMGGRSHYPFGIPIANSEVRNGDTYGVFKLTLHPDSYSWEFVPEAGKTFTDSGSAPCVVLEKLTSSEVLTFTPAEDATVKSDSPDANYGSRGTLQADNNPSDNFLLKFTLSGLNDRPVSSAKLRLYNVNSSDTGGDLYSVADNMWVEDTVTWNTAPTTASTFLKSLGPVDQNTWYEVDVTPLIQGNGTYNFRMSTTSENGADYSSKEGQDGFAPQLVITVDV